MLTVNQILDYEDGELSEVGESTVLQTAINAGQWGLQGSYGRAMMDSIKGGRCMLGRNRAVDYWGNPIPSRADVKPGTPGSYEFVAETMGDDWAEQMQRVN